MFFVSGMCTHPEAFRSFALDAPGWLDSLALPDPYGILPAISILAVLSNIEFSTRAFAKLRSVPLTEKEKSDEQYMLLVLRGATMLFAPMTMWLPSCMYVMLVSNNLMTLGVN